MNCQAHMLLAPMSIAVPRSGELSAGGALEPLLTSNLAGLHDILQSTHRLLERRILIRPMDLQQVDIFEIELLQGSLDRVKDMFTGESLLVGIVTAFAFVAREVTDALRVARIHKDPISGK